VESAAPPQPPSSFFHPDFSDPMAPRSLPYFAARRVEYLFSPLRRLLYRYNGESNFFVMTTTTTKTSRLCPVFSILVVVVKVKPSRGGKGKNCRRFAFFTVVQTPRPSRGEGVLVVINKAVGDLSFPGDPSLLT
jgi:hypothetical protein